MAEGTETKENVATLDDASRLPNLALKKGWKTCKVFLNGRDSNNGLSGEFQGTEARQTWGQQ